jgi:hypothetical protein
MGRKRRERTPAEHLRFQLWFDQVFRKQLRRFKRGEPPQAERWRKSKIRFVLFADVLGSGEGMLRRPDIDERTLGLMPYMADLFRVDDVDRQHLPVPTEHLVLVKFQYVVSRVAEHFFPWQIVAFADSAYIVLDKPEDAALFAIRLMTELQEARIPARIGVGAGTFATIRFDRQEAVGRNYYAAQFAGSGVVHAYKAESKGGKGLRVFVHPSAASHNGNVSWFTKRLPQVTEHASHELDYVWWGVKGTKQQRLDWLGKQERWLRQQQRVSDTKHKVHYSETIAAYERFRGLVPARKARSPR